MKVVSSFFQNSGIWVSLSSVLSKVLAFLMTLFLVRFLPPSEFGILTIALNFIGFFIPAIGLGATHGLLRFGAQKKGVEKENLIAYSLQKGIKNQLLLNILVIVLGYFLNLNQTLVFQLIAIMVVRLLGLFLLEFAKAECRTKFDNKKYSQIEIYTNLIGVVLGVAFTLWFGIWGYVISLCLFPFSVFFFYRFKFSKADLKSSFKKEFWSFSIQSVLTVFVFMAVFLLDVFFVGKYFPPDEVSWYKISTLVPMNLIFVAQVYTQTLYPELCAKHRDKAYLLNFTKQYFSIFAPITLALVGLGFFFSKEIMQIFGHNYTDTTILKIMFIQMASCILFRIPFGNLMSATGKITESLLIGIGIVIGISVLSLLYLPNGKVEYAAYIAVFCVTFGGVLAALYFFYFLYKLK